jgi:hypothetical protein
MILMIGVHALTGLSDDVQEIQYDKNHGNHKQRMNPTSGGRDSGAVPFAEKPKQPENEENDDDCPQHDRSPLFMSLAYYDGYRCQPGAALLLSAKKTQSAA